MRDWIKRDRKELITECHFDPLFGPDVKKSAVKPIWGNNGRNLKTDQVLYDI